MRPVIVTFRRRTLMAAAAVLVLVGAGVAGTNLASAATGCQVSYTITSQWPGGFGASVSVRNLGDPVPSWRLTWPTKA